MHLGFISRNEISSNGQCKYDISSLDANLHHDFKQNWYSALELHSPVTRGEQLPVLGELDSHGYSPVQES